MPSYDTIVALFHLSAKEWAGALEMHIWLKSFMSSACANCMAT